MEIEKSTQIAKKLWNIVRIMFYMTRKSISKTKILIMLDLNMLLKRGKTASKTLGNLMLHRRYSALTCRSEDINTSFISPREYEFSCSNTPIYASHSSRRKNGHHHHQHQHAQELKIMNKVFDILNRYDAIEASPPSEIGRSPIMTGQLRMTDSPSVIKDAEGTHQVDKDAEEFIKKFYKDLKNQKRIAAFDQSPSPYHQLWAN